MINIRDKNEEVIRMKLADFFIRLFTIAWIWLGIFISFNIDDLKLKALTISVAIITACDYIEYIIKVKNER